MPIFEPGPLLGSQSTQYQISRSLRFRSSASAYLSRTPASAGNRQKWTVSFWVKRGTLGVIQSIFTARVDDSNYTQFYFSASDTLTMNDTEGGVSLVGAIASNMVFRDVSAWYHITIVVDTTAAGTNQVKMYVNGNQITYTGTPAYASGNTQVNNTSAQNIGRWAGGSQYFDGYIAEFYLIDGNSTLTPSSFGAFDTNGVWQPAKYTGSYGTNGFYLNFSDNSGATATTIGKDSSGNSNNWTPNNISVTSGTTYDSMIDSPTNYADGGNGRGNYCVLNPLINTAVTGFAISNANLTFTTTSTTSAGTTFNIPISGKWYWEGTVTFLSTGVNLGIYDTAYQLVAGANPANSTVYGYGYDNGGGKLNSGGTAYGASYTTNDVIGVAFDADNGAIYFSKNGTWQNSGVPTSGASKTGAAFTGLVNKIYSIYFAANSSTWSVNFGQRPFTYTPPSGFSALNTQNLPTPTIAAGNKYFDALTYSGNGSLTTRTGLNLSSAPGLVWVKSRSYVESHVIVDSNRGTGYVFAQGTNSTNAEGATGGGWIQNLSTTGFSTDVNTQINTNAATYVSWVWAGGSNVTNTSGSITSTVSANTSAGFSVVTFTGNGTGGATVGHGLGVAPSMIILKRRTAVSNWDTYHASIGNTGGVALNSTAAVATSSAYWNNTSPTSTVFTLGSGVNPSATDCVAYCFAPVAGYSAFGSYTGNGSTDGPFVYTGFRPKFVLYKQSNGANGWIILDSSRDTYNVEQNILVANSSGAEASVGIMDFLSNGFKLRYTGSGTNASGDVIIYAAFAENPFRTARAR